MKCLKLLVVIFCFYGCGISESQYDNLKSENLVLKKRVDSLSKELNDLKFGARNLLAEAKSKIDSKEFISSKDLLLNLINRYPASTESNAAKILLRIIRPKAEAQLFYEAEKSKDAGLFKNYIKQYPGGRYYVKAKNFIRKYQNNENLISAL